MPEDNKFLEPIYEAIREFNGQLPPDSRLTCSPDTILLGEGGLLDSLSLVNLLVLLEDSLADRLGERVLLLDEKLMTAETGPFRSVSALAEYIAAQAGS